MVDALAGAVEAHEQRLSLLPPAVLDFDDMLLRDADLQGSDVDLLQNAEGSGIWNPIGIPRSMVKVYRERHALKLGTSYISNATSTQGIPIGSSPLPLRNQGRTEGT